MKSVFTRTTPKDLDEYLARCLRYRPTFDVARTRETALYSIKKLHATEEGLALEKRWYDSLAAGVPDYSVYDADFFIGDVWSCWVLFSRKYLLAMRSPKVLACGDTVVDSLRSVVKTVVDLGCGFGYSTAALKELFPDADVYGTNIEATCQWGVASEIGSELGFTLATDVATIGRNTDFVFASEYFEHIINAAEHLEDVIIAGNPKVFVFANAFRSRAVGHFEVYQHRNEDVPGKSIGRVFSNVLREHGYEQVKANLWNNRPNIWVKK